MDDAKVLELARAAGFAVADDGSVSDGIETAQDLRPELTAFARLVAEAERERLYQGALERGLEALENRGRLIDEITAAPPPTA